SVPWRAMVQKSNALLVMNATLGRSPEPPPAPPPPAGVFLEQPCNIAKHTARAKAKAMRKVKRALRGSRVVVEGANGQGGLGGPAAGRYTAPPPTLRIPTGGRITREWRETWRGVQSARGALDMNRLALAWAATLTAAAIISSLGEVNAA